MSLAPESFLGISFETATGTSNYRIDHGFLQDGGFYDLTVRMEIGTLDADGKWVISN
jgi:hypothetical protein